MRSFKSKSGITMVEVLVVLGIMGLVFLPVMVGLKISMKNYSEEHERIWVSNAAREAVDVIMDRVRKIEAHDVEVVSETYLKVRKFSYYMNNDNKFVEEHEGSEKELSEYITGFNVLEYTEGEIKYLEITVESCGNIVSDPYEISTKVYLRGK